MDNENNDVWETEDEDLVVMGTHDLTEVIPKLNRFFEENLEGEDLARAKSMLEKRTVEESAHFLWVDPAKMDDEYWGEDAVSKEPLELWKPFTIIRF